MIYSEQYGETVTAEQDQEFCKVRSPASVESMGSNPCISVAVYSNQLKMAWMVHMSRHPDNTDELHEMLSDVSEETGGGGMTKSLIIGGDGNYT
ncbi:hypothetical protein, partial [Komagataeibacter rhaeticus]|uniref:hypothetical protein n=1 Tax=Komagataeibacter rhaeticus TaxID=215221 RepID=UPI0039EA0770